MLRRSSAREYPALNEILVGHVLERGFDYMEEFEFGLDLLLAGLERVRDDAAADEGGASAP